MVSKVLSSDTTTTTIFISYPEKFIIDKYMQREKLTIKIEHSHLERAKANRAKWLGQAEKYIAIKLEYKKKKKTGHDFHSHTHTLIGSFFIAD